MNTPVELLCAIEGSLLAYAEAPRFEWLDLPGLQGRALRGSQHPLYNIVGVAKCAAADADAALVKARTFFAERGEVFGFTVGPLSQPDDWRARLGKAGFSLALATAGMIRTDLSAPMWFVIILSTVIRPSSRTPSSSPPLAIICAKRK